MDEIGKKIKLPDTLVKMRGRIETKAYDIMYKKEMDKTNDKIKSLYNIHDGKKCFLVGNGPSLNDTDFKKIRNETFFCVNAFYFGTEKFGIKAKHWVVGDGMLFENNYKKIMEMDTNLFLASQAAKRFLERKEYFMKYAKEEPMLLKNVGKMNNKNKFATDILKGVTGGGGITTIALQIIYYLGYSEVYLLGCDCGSKGDKHHFYEKRTESMKCKDYSNIFKVYEFCKNAYEKDGRAIFNSTVGGNLEVFERKNMGEI